ncbi:MAG TPA: hypothetical protein VM936_22775 [Pyrinomonadaceae bacterium]|jgi:hypothetical protein|nr:hypothetical protein [Pyrinomonadaceae bacterium]
MAKLSLIFVTAATPPGTCMASQVKRWRAVRGKPLVVFDYTCATPSALPRARLDKAVRAALKEERVDLGAEGDRAFAFDLNGDREQEYFVPLVCGAVGNCTWGVFARNPPRLLGVLSGQYVYVHRLARRLPDVIVYYHMNAAEGGLITYGFSRGRYVSVGGDYAIGANSPTEIEGLPAHKMPKFLKKARPACHTLGGQ